MKTLFPLVVGACLLGLMLPPTAMAAKADGKKAKLIAKYDKNGNGTIDGDEMDALRKDFEGNKEGDLKTYDKNGDGQLSDEEIQAIKPGANKKTKAGSTGEKSKKEKKEQPGESEKPDVPKKDDGSGKSTDAGDSEASK